MQAICLDTGVLSIHFSQSETRDVRNLFQKIQQGNIEAHILNAVLIEEFKHLCRLRGVDSAKTLLQTFVQQFRIRQVDLTMPLIFKAGTLKCQYSAKLSYIDCMCIAYALNTKIPLHTTEKTLKKIPSTMLKKLKVVEYRFL